ncbi:MAG: hypothetical protein RL311_406 [Bacteroidota bacterium]|jgi:hypothetical protein
MVYHNGIPCGLCLIFKNTKGIIVKIKSKQEKVRETTGNLEKLVERFFRTDNNDENTKNNLMNLIYPEFKKILGAARRRFHFQEADHENIVSSVLVAFLRGTIKLSVRFDGNKGSLSNWLFMLYYRNASDFFENKVQHSAISLSQVGENHRSFAIDSLAEANVFYKDSLRGSLAFADKQFSNLEAYVWKRTIDDASLDDLMLETGFSKPYLSKIRYKVSLACQCFFMPA